jgi:hypothetical protein
MSLWIVSDHGHSSVKHHEDLAALIEAAGIRTMSHPWVYNIAPEVAVMVSGNAMAHLYMNVAARQRPAASTDRIRSLVEHAARSPVGRSSHDADGQRSGRSHATARGGLGEHLA